MTTTIQTAYLDSDPNASWPSQIPLITTDDPVLGNKGGPVNVPHQLLYNGLQYLKTKLDALKSEVTHIGGNYNVNDLTNRVVDLENLATEFQTSISSLDVRTNAITQSLDEILRDIADLKTQVGDLEAKSLYVFAFTCS